MRGSAGGSDPDPSSTGLESVPGAPGRQRFHLGGRISQEFRYSPSSLSKQPKADRPLIYPAWLALACCSSKTVRGLAQTIKHKVAARPTYRLIVVWYLRSSCRRVMLWRIRLRVSDQASHRLRRAGFVSYRRDISSPSVALSSGSIAARQTRTTLRQRQWIVNLPTISQVLGGAATCSLIGELS